MGMIAIACYDTVENERSKYTQETLLSLYDTVDFGKHRIVLIDNNSCIETKKLMCSFKKQIQTTTIIKLNENIGTARAINMALKLRKPNEVCIKMDNDIIVHQKGWVDELVDAIYEWPLIGILGLRRDDVYGEFIEVNKYSLCDDIMGSCTAINPKLLDAIGYYRQFSNYGYDDVIYSARSLAAGFRNAFLPHIKISHIDPGGTEYTDWKKKEAGLYLNEVSSLINMYKTGQLSPYYDGGEDI